MAVIKQETFHEVWDCSCGTVGLSAYNCKQCPNCGRPLSNDSTRRTRTLVENYQFKGHDIICAHCKVRNEKRFSCLTCGASLTDGDDKRVQSFIYKSGADYEQQLETRSQSLVIPTPARSARRPGPSRISGQSVDNHRKWWLAGGTAVIVFTIVVIWVITQLTAVIPVTLTADRAHWAYHLALEDYQPRAKTITVEDDESASPPSDAYNIDREQVFIRSEPIYDTRTVSKNCTSTSPQSNGDGTWTETTYTYDCSYTEQVQVGTDDVWGTQFNYTVDRWEATTPLTKDGWTQAPDFPLFSTSESCLSVRPGYGCKRALDEPRLTFTIHFFYHHEKNGKRQDVARVMARDTWETIVLNADYPAILNGFGKIRAIEGIDPKYDALMAD